MDDQQTVEMPATPESSPPAPGSPGPPPGASLPPRGGRSTWTMVLAAVLAVVLLGGCAILVRWQRERTARLEQRAAEVQQALDELEESPQVADPADSDGGSATEDGGASGGSASSDGDGPAVVDEDEDGLHICYIVTHYEIDNPDPPPDSLIDVEVDYVQMFTGADAVEAAADRGDPPPDGDYYIANDNPRLRRFRIDPTVRIIMWSWPGSEGTAFTTDYGQWKLAIFGPGEDPMFLAIPYWITVENGLIVEIEEQYLP